MTNNHANYFTDINKQNWSDLKDKKILILNTQWNEEIINSMTNAAIKLLEFANVKFEIKTVPGAYELPYASKKFSKDYDGIITIGCVIKGDTFHFEAIALSASLNIQKVSIETEVPIAFGVITVNNIEQALERSQDNQTNKGLEAAAALLDLMVL